MKMIIVIVKRRVTSITSIALVTTPFARKRCNDDCDQIKRTLKIRDNISTIKAVNNEYKKVKPTPNKIRTLKKLNC